MKANCAVCLSCTCDFLGKNTDFHKSQIIFLPRPVTNQGLRGKTLQLNSFTKKTWSTVFTCYLTLFHKNPNTCFKGKLDNFAKKKVNLHHFSFGKCLVILKANWFLKKYTYINLSLASQPVKWQIKFSFGLRNQMGI